jgi:hypothetical protein
MKTQTKLLSSMRKLVDELAQDNEVPEWEKVHSKVLSKFEFISKQIEQFSNRAKKLREWKLVNDKLASLELHISRFRRFDLGFSELAERFDAQVAALRERFATSNWEPLDESHSARSLIDPIEEAVQKRAFDRLFIFQQMRAEFNSVVGWASSLAPPDFSLNGADPYSALLDWTISSSELAFQTIGHIESFKLKWKDPTGTKLTLRDLLNQVEKALRTAKEMRTDISVRKVISFISRLTRGFEDEFSFPQVFRNKEAPLNFEALRKAYLEGKVEIQVTPVR